MSMAVSGAGIQRSAQPVSANLVSYYGIRPISEVETFQSRPLRPLQRAFRRLLSMKGLCKQAYTCVLGFPFQNSHIHGSLCKFLQPFLGFKKTKHAVIERNMRLATTFSEKSM